MKDSEDSPNYAGMTVNERLYESGLMAAFDKAVYARNRKAMLAILRQVDVMPPELTADPILADPARYGYGERVIHKALPLPRWQALALIAALSLIWGYNWVMMKVAVTYSPPFSFAAIRFLGGAIVLMATLKLMGRSLRFRALLPRWRVIVLIGCLQTALCFSLVTWALSTGAAGRSAVLNYTMPLWVLVFSVLLLKERVPRAQWVAAGLALIGILLISAAGGKSGSLPAVLLALGAGLTWGLGVVVTKRATRDGAMDPLALTAWQMLTGAVMLCIVALIVPEAPIDWNPAFITALLYNIGPATPLAYVIWFFLLNRLDAGLAALGILLTPLLGLLLSTLQLGERPGLVEGVGMGLILVAIAGLGWASGRQARRKSMP